MNSDGLRYLIREYVTHFTGLMDFEGLAPLFSSAVAGGIKAADRWLGLRRWLVTVDEAEEIVHVHAILVVLRLLSRRRWAVRGRLSTLFTLHEHSKLVDQPQSFTIAELLKFQKFEIFRFESFVC